MALRYLIKATLPLAVPPRVTVSVGEPWVWPPRGKGTRLLSQQLRPHDSPPRPTLFQAQTPPCGFKAASGASGRCLSGRSTELTPWRPLEGKPPPLHTPGLSCHRVWTPHGKASGVRTRHTVKSSGPWRALRGRAASKPSPRAPARPGPDSSLPGGPVGQPIPRLSAAAGLTWKEMKTSVPRSPAGTARAPVKLAIY